MGKRKGQGKDKEWWEWKKGWQERTIKGRNGDENARKDRKRTGRGRGVGQGHGMECWKRTRM